MQQSQISYHTTCKDCVFQIKNGNKQTGCFGQDISKEKLVGDNDDFTFKNKICQFKRLDFWSTGSLSADWKRARKEVTLQYTAASIVKTKEEADNFYACAANQSLKPNKIFLAFSDHAEYGRFKVDGKVPWQSFRFYNPNQIYGILLNSCQTNLIWFSEPKPIVPFNYFEKLDKKVNDEGFRFLLLRDENYNNYIASKKIYLMQTEPFYYSIRELKSHDIISGEPRSDTGEYSSCCGSDGDCSHCCSSEEVGSCSP